MIATTLSWTLLAGAVSVPVWKLGKMLWGLVEWESPGSIGKVGGPVAVAVFGAGLALSFYGGGGVILGGGGGGLGTGVKDFASSAPSTWDTLYASGSFSTLDPDTVCSDRGTQGGSSWAVVGDYYRMTSPQGVTSAGGWCDLFFDGTEGRPNELTHGTLRFEADIRLSSNYSGDQRMLGIFGTTPGNHFDAAGRAGDCVDDDLTSRFFLVRSMFGEQDENNRLGPFDQFVSQTGTTLGNCFAVDGSGGGFGTAGVTGGDYDPVGGASFTLANELRLNNFGDEDGQHVLYIDGSERRDFDNINYRNTGSEVVFSGVALKPVYGTSSPSPGDSVYMEFTNLRILWDSTAVPPGERTPDTPTVDTSSVDSTSVRLTSSAFSSPGSDTHAQSIWEVDVGGGDFYPPVSADTTSDSLTANTLSGLSADTDYKAMVIHVGSDGGGSFRSDTIAFTTDTIESGGGSLPADLVFATSWSSATGTSDGAVQDSARTRYWETIGSMGQNSNAEVVSAPAGFPSTNVLDLETFSGTMYIDESAGYWSALSAGEYITHRFLMQMTGGGEISFRLYTNAGTTNWTSGSLGQDSIVEVQVRARVLAGPDYELDVRVYDDPTGDRTLRWDESDFTSGSNNLGNTTHSASAALIDRFNGMSLGISEDFSGSPTHPFYPTESFVESGFNDAPWAFHPTHDITTGGGDYIQVCCWTITRGTTGSGDEWPLRAWTDAEESWDPS